MTNQNYLKTRDYVFRNDPAFPLKAGVMDPQSVTIPHRHEFTECILIIGGEGVHQCEKDPARKIRRGEIIVIPSGGSHTYLEVNELVLINLLFDVSRLPPVLLELYGHPAYRELFMQSLERYREKGFPYFTPAPEAFGELELFALRLAQAGPGPGRHGYRLGLFMVLLNLLCDAYSVKQVEFVAPPLDIPGLVAFLERNFQREIYLDELTGWASMSRATLLRHFHAALGMTPMAYLRELRLRHAAELLVNTEFSLKEIAGQSGFFSEAYFFRAFKKQYGISPSSFRKNSGAIA